VRLFEDSMIEIQNMLPKDTHIKTCVSCKYSSYYPLSSGMFGELYCFKKLKTYFKNVSDKQDLMNLFDNGSKEKKISSSGIKIVVVKNEFD